MERRIAKGNACCRGCDVDLRKGKDELIYTYSHRNRGQNILFCLDCAKKIGKLAGSDIDHNGLKLPPDYKVTEDMDIGAKYGLEKGYRKAIEDVKLLNGIKS